MKTNRLHRFLVIAAVLLLVFTAGGCAGFPSAFQKMGNIRKEAATIVGNLYGRLTAAVEKRNQEEAARAGAEESRAAEEAARAAAEQGIWNVLLIGSDRRDASWNGNSDMMILVSVNGNTRNFRMVSFMRDTYVNIPGVGGRKLNSAYAIAGAPLLLETIRSNFSVRIDNYVAVDFSSMVAVINTMGGIDIEVNEAEAGFLGITPGWHHMDGELALSYSRIRKIGNADYERTSRQRRVLSAMFSQLRQMDNMTRVSVATQLLGIIETDIGADRIAWALANIGTLIEYDIITDRIPYDGLYTHSGEDLVPDFAATNARLYQFLH